jgi:hypothetical protein
MDNIEQFDIDKREEKSKKLPIIFYHKIIFDEKESLEQKKLIFKNKPFIDIDTGENDIKTFPVKEEFKKRYKDQWDLFKNFIAPLIKTDNEIIDLQTIYTEYPEIYKKYKENVKNVVGYEGTLIEEINIYPLTKAIELKYYGYFYLEQILELTEENEIISKEMIEIAKKWKEKQEENEVLKKQVLELSNLVNQLTTRLQNG